MASGRRNELRAVRGCAASDSPTAADRSWAQRIHAAVCAGVATLVCLTPAYAATVGLQSDRTSYCVSTGESIHLALEVADLPQAIGGVQALVRYDANIVSLAQVLPGDANGSPWDAAIFPGSTAVNADTVALPFVLPDGGAAADAVVARLVFTALIVGPIRIEIIPEASGAGGGVFQTRLTRYPPADPPILPQIEGAYDSIVTQRYDADASGVIDLGDFARLCACMTGGGGPVTAYPLGAPRNCRCLDSDDDGDIDLADFARFQTVIGDLAFVARRPNGSVCAA